MNTETTLHENRVTTLNDVLTVARILVVDDDAALRELHEVVLGSAGYEAYGAADGEEALANLRSGQFDLVVTDGKMPRLDGFGLIRQLRVEGIDVPVVMFSGSYTEGDNLPEDIRDQVVGILNKPSGSLRLLTEVRRALQLRSAAATAVAA